MRTKKLFSLLACLLAVWSLSAQPITVTGTVTDADTGEEIYYANVSIKGSTTGTTTNERGKYAIPTKMGDVLVFSFLGYDSYEVTVIKQVHDVVLKPSSQQLSEVIITGSGKRTRTRSKDKQAEYSDAAAPIAMGYAQTGVMADASQNKQMVLNYSDYDNQQNEEYGALTENKFIFVSAEPLSTFSIDVDAASYSNMRRYISKGQMPPADAIRTEELVNYFSYSYPKPTGNDPVSITTEVGVCPWNEQHRLVRVGLKAREMASDDMPASNLVFLIDVSGSMYGATRLDLVKASLKLLVNNLRDKDRVAIVVYAGSAGEVLPSTSGSDKQKIREALEGLTAGGSTAGGAGIQLAYKIAKKSLIENGNNRVILCTDGDFNVGVSSNQELENLIAAERKSGIFLTVLGYGMGNYKDSKMQTLAEKGNGNHAYIDNLQEANKVLVNEFGATLYTVAKDVKLQLEFNPSKVQAYRLIGYESRLLKKEDFNDDTKDAGEMGAGHTVTAFYEVVPVGVSGSIGTVDPLKYQKNQPTQTIANIASPEMLTVKLRYKQPKEDTSKKMEIPLVDKGGNNTSNDFRFASAVAMFGQLLHKSEYVKGATFDKVVSLAKTGLDNDAQGYRREFVRLAETAAGMAKGE